jgi:hypothetical protein
MAGIIETQTELVLALLFIRTQWNMIIEHDLLIVDWLYCRYI